MMRDIPDQIGIYWLSPAKPVLYSTQDPRWRMLDAFIIEQIRRERQEREKRDGARAPLRIDVPLQQPEPEPGRREPPHGDRGTEIIDFQL